MKRVTFLLILSVVQILKCHGFEFRNIFGSYAKDTPSYASSNTETSSLSNNLLDNDEKLRNVSEDEPKHRNVSNSALSELEDGVIVQKQNISNESFLDANLTDLVLNGTGNPVNVLKSEFLTSTEKSSSVTLTSTKSTTTINHVSIRTNSSSGNVTTSTEEPEEVVLGEKPSTFGYITKTIYKKTVDFMGDTYTLSIFLPIAGGVLFAVTIILTIVTCRCIRKKCRRRKFRKRVLPDSIKSLRPSDQARLLGDCCDSSDEF